MIFMGEKVISSITSNLEAEKHKHHMMQVFIAIEAGFDIKVLGKKLSCNFLVVDSNVEHEFKCNDNLVFTMVIEATSNIAEEIKEKYIKDNDYYIFSEECFERVKEQCLNLLENNEKYNGFLEYFYDILELKNNAFHSYDDRVVEILKVINECDCTDHSLERYSREVYLSQSRLAHLFKEQTGIPLKSYIVLHKLKKAYEFILKGDNITEASYKAGFSTPSHLAETNKKLTGMSVRGVVKDSDFSKVSIK
ncbi:MAG: helix-turn-helix domain-containing protein [Clostridium sp.]